MRKTLAYGLALTVMAATLPGCKPPEASAPFTGKGRWIDLSYDFSPATLYWPNNPTGFRLDTVSEGMTPGGFYYSTYSFSAPEHGGTHLDAPKHFAKGHPSVDLVPLTQITGAAWVIDVSAKALADRDYLISIDDIKNWEVQYGKIPENAILLFRTGYGKFYPDPKTYFGTDEKGVQAIPKLHFPGLDPRTADWLVRERKIKAIGLDTPSIDFGQSKDFRTHQVLCAANVPVFENIASLDSLPVSGAYVIALPMKIKHGSGGPLRIIAWLRQE
jgi:kynurenine formamidase